MGGMHRVLLAACLLLSLSVSAQDAPGYIRRWSEAQALTRSAPTVSCLAASGAEGIDFRGVRGYYVRIEADSGQTLSGAGTLQAWRYDFGEGAWARVPDLDRTIPAGASGMRRYGFSDRINYDPSGCFLFAASGVTVSGGTVTVRITAWTPPGSVM